MTTPATREEVVELMARDRWERQREPRREVRWEDLAPVLQASVRRGVTSDLTALEQHGLALVPVEATRAMELAARDHATRHRFSSEGAIFKAMILSSPYNKETGNGG